MKDLGGQTKNHEVDEGVAVIAAAYFRLCEKNAEKMVKKGGKSLGWQRLKYNLCVILEAEIHQKEIFTIEDEC